MKKMSYVGKITKFQIVERKHQTFIGLNKISLPWFDNSTNAFKLGWRFSDLRKLDRAGKYPKPNLTSNCEDEPYI